MASGKKEAATKPVAAAAAEVAKDVVEKLAGSSIGQAAEQGLEKLAKKAPGLIGRFFENLFHALSWEAASGLIRPQKAEGKEEAGGETAGKMMKLTMLNQVAMTRFTNLLVSGYPLLAQIIWAVYDRFIPKDTTFFSVSLWTAMFTHAFIKSPKFDECEWWTPLVEVDGTPVLDEEKKPIPGPNIENDVNYSWFVKQVGDLLTEAVKSCPTGADQDALAKACLNALKVHGIIANGPFDEIARLLSPKNLLANARRWMAPAMDALRDNAANARQTTTGWRARAREFRLNQGRI